VVFSPTIAEVDRNARPVTGDAVAEIVRLEADDGGPRHTVLHRAGRPVDPDPVETRMPPAVRC
jgi:hypothetical protein